MRPATRIRGGFYREPHSNDHSILRQRLYFAELRLDEGLLTDRLRT